MYNKHSMILQYGFYLLYLLHGKSIFYYD